MFLFSCRVSAATLPGREEAAADGWELVDSLEVVDGDDDEWDFIETTEHLAKGKTEKMNYKVSRVGKDAGDAYHISGSREALEMLPLFQKSLKVAPRSVACHLANDVMAMVYPDQKGHRNQISLWSLSGYRKKSVFHSPEVQYGNVSAIRSLAYSGDGETLVSGGDDGSVRVWNPRTGKQKKKHLHQSFVYSVACNGDGTRFASGGKDGSIFIWSLDSKDPRIISGHTDVVHNLVYKANGTRILSGSLDKTVREWDVDSGKLVQIFRGHLGAVLDVRYSEDESRIIAEGSYEIIEWRATTGALLCRFSL